MTDKELFKAVFQNFQKTYSNLEMEGTLVSYRGEVKFNTDGFNLAYNLHRLTNLLAEAGLFR